MQGLNPQKLYIAEQHGKDTTILHTILTSCAILATMHNTNPKTLELSHSLNECKTAHQKDTKNCSLHSLLHSRQPISPMNSVAIKFSHLQHALLTLHACQHAALPTPLPFTILCSPQSEDIVAKISFESLNLVVQI